MGTRRGLSKIFEAGEKKPLAEPDHLIEVGEGCTP
jgi:hypothetical protein